MITANRQGRRLLFLLAILLTLGFLNAIPVAGQTTETGTLSGTVTDATTGDAIEGATVNIGDLSATTDSDGNYTIDQVPVGTLEAEFTADVTSGSAPLDVQFTDQSTDGTRTVSASADGYLEYVNRNVSITANTTLTMDMSLSPDLAGGQVRIVLNWAADPRDLDSHLLTPEIEGSTYHVSYLNKGNAESAPYVTLDHDVTDGYGPETITVYDFFAGTYAYYIYKYNGTGEIIDSDAIVQVYGESGLIQTVYVPTTGTGRYWHVLNISGSTGDITIVNTIAENPPANTAHKSVARETTMPKPDVTTASILDVQSWNWDFGDGTTSTEQNPQHTYENAGTYSVELAVFNGETSVTTTKYDYISVEGDQTGTLEGTVTDAVTGDPIVGATVSVAGMTDQTDSDGNYRFLYVPVGELEADFRAAPTSGGAPLAVQFTDLSTDGSQTVTASTEGYNEYSNRYVTIQPGEITTLDISLSPELTGGSMRMVLNWGADPRDLDSHLLTPEIEGGTHHIYFSNRGNADAAPYAALDHDVTDGYGPETVTIYDFFEGVYHYYIYKYAGNGEITTSSAVVQIYSDAGLLYTVQAPASGEGDYWYVCDIDGATQAVTIVNTIGTSAPSNSPMQAVQSIPEKKMSDATDNIAADITVRSWDFGDGATSTEQNPSHTYSAAGNYTVSLTVSNGESSITEIKTDYIVVNSTTVPDTLLYESFEGALENWSVFDNDQDGDTWAVYQEELPPDTIAHTGTHGAGTYYNADGNDDWIITPAIAIPEAEDVTFSFWANSFAAEFLEDFNVRLSTTGNNLGDFTVFLDEVTGTPATWTEYTYDLSAYTGETIYLAIQCVSVDKYYLFTDDYLVVADRTTDAESEITGLPSEFNLQQNYPNPFNPTTRIRYDLPVAGQVSLQVFDLQGRLIRTLMNEYQPAGNRECLWNGLSDDGTPVSSGVYYYRLKAGDYVQVRKMLYMK